MLPIGIASAAQISVYAGAGSAISSRLSRSGRSAKPDRNA